MTKHYDKKFQQELPDEFKRFLDDMAKSDDGERAPYFVYEVSEVAYEKIKRGEYPFIIIYIGYTTTTDIMKIGFEITKDGTMHFTFELNYSAVKIKRRGKRNFMCFDIYDMKLGQTDKETYFVLFLGDQIRINGERIGDKCDVDMKAKSIEYIRKNLEEL